MIRFACRDKGTESEEIIQLLWLPPLLDFSHEIIRYVPDESDPFTTTVTPDLFRIYFGRSLYMGQIAKVRIELESTPTTTGEAKQLGWIR